MPTLPAEAFPTLRRHRNRPASLWASVVDLYDRSRQKLLGKEVPMSQHLDPASITPADSPLTYGDIMSSPFHAELFTPTVKPGDMAPDFVLERVDEPGVTVSLGDVARNQPVALIFGSYT